MESYWGEKLIKVQKEDGSWGPFHSLSSKAKITTEQALKRLECLGYTIKDQVISKAINYMNDCLIKKQIPDRQEKSHDWEMFTQLILATWIRRFTSDNSNAKAVAIKWARVITSSFSSGMYNPNDYVKAYLDVFNRRPKGDRLLDIGTFYQVSIVRGLLDKKTCELFSLYLINSDKGIYYLYDKPLTELPSHFKSKETSRFLYTIEQVANLSPIHLEYVVKWLYENQIDGVWDMGREVKDHILFPLSNSWKTDSLRINDCTKWICKIIDLIEIRKY